MKRALAALVGIGVGAASLGACGGAPIPLGTYDEAYDAPRGRTREGRLPIRWTKRIAPEDEGPYLPIERSVPALDARADRIYVGSSAGALWALSGAGTEIWMYQAGGAIGSQPLVDPDRDEVYVASDDGRLHALVASTGEVRWHAEVGGAVGRPPVASDDAIYIITDADVVTAFDRSTGEALWRYRREAPEGFYVTEHAGLALTERQLITGFTDGVVVALDPRDGAVLWERDTTADLRTTSDTIRFTDVDTTPLVIGDTVYVASFAGGLYALERSSGSVRWLREELTGITGLAEAPGGLVIASSGDLGVMALRATDGERVWTSRIGRGSPTVPRVVGDVVIVGESEGGLLTLSLGRGTELGRIEAGHGFAAPAEFSEGLGGVVSNSGTLFVFRLL
ncbi:PQQ-binding-like beta-propeller repeat protein [Sandaracinus amylolyticus]|uniref:Putative cell surface protein n=1 Tax=Sandaracinus amylolyticus TaxID=927083 RepID=A0A0F6W436_9BACT|nr:PQQ-binding-like beta-propeller repeat protein [Sandaracinus amylolyticus]AKF06905.1 putative cell surface protein [Sandaracinus amylolyticus]